jgi:TRAP-type C4-dicarboxylate transport system substrate-binding protein
MKKIPPARFDERPSMNFFRIGLLALPLLTPLVAPVAAQEAPLTLRMADSLPAGHFLYEIVSKPFMEAATAASHGRLKFQHFPSEQLGKARDLLRLTQHGVMDVGYVVPSYQAEKLPLSAVAELPGAIGSDLCTGTRAFWNLTREGQFLRVNEFDKQGMRPLVVFIMSGYQLELSSNRKVTQLADLQGLKLRTTGAAMDLLVRALGGVPMHISPAEIYESMSRGTIDGTVLAHQSVVSYKLTELLKSSTTDQSFASVVLTYSISEKRWRQLPPDIQQALADAGEQVTHDACLRLGKREAGVRDSVMQKGVQPITLPAEDRPKLQQVFQEVRRQWAETLDRQGRQGSAAVAAWDAALKQAEQDTP